MLNKLPINICFISGHNQCRTDRADQLTLLIQGKELEEAHPGEGWDRQWHADKKERVSDSGEISLSSVHFRFQTPGSHMVQAPGVWCGRHRDRKQTWTISLEEEGVTGPWPLSSGAGCVWRGVCIGKAAAPLFSSHLEHSNKARLHIPLLTPSTPGNCPGVCVRTHLCTCVTIDRNFKDKRLIPTMNIISSVRLQTVDLSSHFKRTVFTPQQNMVVCYGCVHTQFGYGVKMTWLKSHQKKFSNSCCGSKTELDN